MCHISHAGPARLLRPPHRHPIQAGSPMVQSKQVTPQLPSWSCGTSPDRSSPQEPAARKAHRRLGAGCHQWVLRALSVLSYLRAAGLVRVAQALMRRARLKLRRLQSRLIRLRCERVDTRTEGERRKR